MATKKVHIDTSKLLGFRLLDQDRTSDGVRLGGKIGEKGGVKGAGLQARLGAKVGGKVGRKGF